MWGPFISYLAKPLPQVESGSPLARVGANQTKSIVTISFLGAVTAIFQSAGGLLPGLGFLVSPLATAPIVLATLISLRSGLTAYALCNLLLLLIQPSELIVFPFTTGLLGLALGTFIRYFKNRIQVVLLSAIMLWVGVTLVLYTFRFPLLGPSFALDFRIDIAVYVFLFSMFYSGMWTEICIRLLARLSSS